MNVKKEIMKDINFHIEKLEKRLKDIYKLPMTSEYFEGRNEKEVYILEQIDISKAFISIYSILDGEEIRISKTADEYYSYLENLRKGLKILESEKEAIEEKNWKEIENINLLLMKLNEKANEINS